MDGTTSELYNLIFFPKMRDSSNKLESHFGSSIVYAEDDQKRYQACKKKGLKPIHACRRSWKQVFHQYLTASYGGVFGLRDGEQ